MKKIIFVFMAISTFSLQSFFLENLFKLKEGAQEQRKAVKELEKHLADIKIGKKITYPGRGVIPSKVTCYTKAASKSYEDYLATEGSLGVRIFASQLVDGFILGLLAACCNAQLDFPIPIVCATVAAAITLVKHQNDNLGSIPYFDEHLKKHEFEYTMGSIYSVFNIACILLAAKLSSQSVMQWIPTNHAFQPRNFQLSIV